MSQTKRYFVSATEVAAYVYCAESWRLRHGLGLRGAGQGRLQQGEVEHARWQDLERSTQRRRRLALALILLGVFWFVMSRVRGLS